MIWRKKIEITPGNRETILDKLRKMVPELSILTLIFFRLAADYSIDLVEEDLRMDRICLTYTNFTDDECHLIKDSNFSYIKETVLEHSEDYDRTSTIISVVIAVIVIAFASSWSDRHGRKALLISSTIGYFLAGIVYLLFASTDHWSVDILLIATALRSLVGGEYLFLMAVFSMMVDKVSMKHRTLHIGSITNMIIIGQATGYVAGMIVRGWSHNQPFWVIFFSLLLYVISIGISVFIIREHSAIFRERMPPKNNNSIIDLIHPKGIYDLVHVPFRKRESDNKLNMLLILCVTFFVRLSPPHLMSEWVTTSLQWQEIDYTIVSAVSVVACQITTTVFLRKNLKRPVHECLVATIAESMTAIQDLLLLVVIKPEISAIVFLAMLFSITHNLSNVGIRASLLKLCDENEIGRIFGIMAIQNTIMTWAESVIYQTLYDNTREIFSTSQHILSASFAVFNSIMLSIVYISMRKNPPTSTNPNADSPVTESSKTVTDKNQIYQSTDNHKIATDLTCEDKSYDNPVFE